MASIYQVAPNRDFAVQDIVVLYMAKYNAFDSINHRDRYIGVSVSSL
jgi:hypothetical protein